MTETGTTFTDRKKEQEEKFAEPMDLIGQMGFLDAFPGAQKVKFKGKELEVWPLSTDDYIPWCRELTEAMHIGRVARIPKGVTPVEEYKIKTDIYEREITPDDIKSIIFRVASLHRIIETALKKHLTEDEIDEFKKTRPAKATEMLAILLSGLYTMEEFNRAYMQSIPMLTKEQARTFGQNGNGQTAPFVAGESGASSPNPSGLSGEQTTGQRSESESEQLPVEKQEA